MGDSETRSDAAAAWDDSCSPVPSHAGARHRGPRTAAPPPFDGLLETIESEVIPRLLLLHRAGAQSARAADARATREDVEELARLVLSSHGRVASSYVEALMQEGMALETLYLDLLAPTARELGELWKADRCSFADVTLGLYRLQQLVFEVGGRHGHGQEGAGGTGRSILLVNAIGDQHTFGLVLLHEAFTRAGWTSAVEHPASLDALGALVAEREFDVVGISSARTDMVGQVGACVRVVRRASRESKAGILVGGAAFTANPKLAHDVGADGTAADAAQAVDQAARLLYLLGKVDSWARS